MIRIGVWGGSGLSFGVYDTILIIRSHPNIVLKIISPSVVGLKV